MLVRDVMTPDVVTVSLDDTLESIRAIFLASRFHHLIVVEGGHVVGVISDRDLLKTISPFIGNPLMERSQDRNTLQRRAHQVMSRRPVVVHEDTDLSEAAATLLRERVSCLPVVDEEMQPRGIVTWRDLLQFSTFGGGSGARPLAA
ncbi:MAG TPA: CBS domain-containing protein [Phycisphaerales bacterium]|nr:CBS domain-containing protein [Phycisphaerales bacterium]